MSSSDLFCSMARALELLIDGFDAELKEGDTDGESALRIVQEARRNSGWDGLGHWTLLTRILCDGQTGSFTWWDKEEW